MKILGYELGKKQDEFTQIDEATKEFQNVGIRMTPEEQAASRGEGWESIHQIPGVGHLSLTSFNSFYSNYIDRMYENEVGKIFTYREMAAFTEVADVIEEATNESSQIDQDDRVIHLEIIDPELAKNENIVNNLNKEFNNLFYNQFSNAQDNFQDKLWDMIRSYYIDGRVYYERVINTNDKTKGIVNLKKLPSETMDYIYNPTNGEIEVYMQYLRKHQGVQRPKTLEEAIKREDVVVFLPEQIGFVNYGIYGRTKQEIFGYLEKARVPYNQLKLLEISVIIYRLIRSPERLVFRIDTGNMPRDKALKYVEKIKQKLSKKQTYNPQSGELTNEPEIFSLLENYYLPQCIGITTKIPLLDGRIITLEKIINEHNNGIKHEVYSVDQKTGKILRGNVDWAGITRKNTDLVRIHLDNKEYLDVTPDHKFVLRNGSEIEAQNLQEGDSLMPLYKDGNKIYDLNINKWVYEKKCLECGDLFFGLENRKFCCPGHSSSYNNRKRILSDETKNKISQLKKEKGDWSDNKNPKWNNGEEIKGKNNPNWKGGYHTNNIPFYDTYAPQLELYDSIKKNSEDLNVLEVKCAYCGKWFIPTLSDVSFRLSAIKGQRKGFSEHRLYCSEGCKQECPIFNKQKNPKGFKPATSREVQPELRQMCLERDEFTCQKCGKTQNELNVGLHCHHIEGIRWEPLESADLDTVIIFCKNCHIAVHKLPDCGYNDMKCDDYSDFIINHKVVKVEKLIEKADTGCLTIKDSGNNHNFALAAGVFVKNSADGRGSQIETVGGNPAGFSELDDIHYFAKKMYRALKYPMSRVNASQEKQDSDIMFGGSNTGEISRDEVKWAKFLERQQNKFNREFTKLFLVHMEFRGLKREYNLDMKKIRVKLNPPSNYKEQMEQNFQETRYNNYQALADRNEMSKYYLMKKFLKWNDDDIKENVEGLKKDRELGLSSSDGGY